jgi:YtoQ family protein
MSWHVYLSGEIHTDWRERIERGAAAAGLEFRFTGPVTDHTASDQAGTAILGEQESSFWNDHLGAGVNAIRTRTLIEKADVVVVRFGEQYRQWKTRRSTPATQRRSASRWSLCTRPSTTTPSRRSTAPPWPSHANPSKWSTYCGTPSRA